MTQRRDRGIAQPVSANADDEAFFTSSIQGGRDKANEVRSA